jgi:hypothetical protein
MHHAEVGIVTDHWRWPHENAGRPQSQAYDNLAISAKDLHGGPIGPAEISRKGRGTARRSEAAAHVVEAGRQIEV